MISTTVLNDRYSHAYTQIGQSLSSIDVSILVFVVTRYSRVPRFHDHANASHIAHINTVTTYCNSLLVNLSMFNQGNWLYILCIFWSVHILVCQ